MRFSVRVETPVLREQFLPERSGVSLFVCVLGVCFLEDGKRYETWVGCASAGVILGSRFTKKKVFMWERCCV